MKRNRFPSRPLRPAHRRRENRSQPFTERRCFRMAGKPSSNRRRTNRKTLLVRIVAGLIALLMIASIALSVLYF